MPNKVKPTPKQKATIEILKENPNMEKGPAMIKGGYSPKTSTHPKQNFVDLKGTAIVIEQWRKELRGSGLGEQKIKEKLQEWIDAQKIKTSLTEPDEIVPDYKTQIEAGKMVRKDLGMETETPNVLQQFNIGGEMSLKFTEDDK